jgi:tetratricopeptide (TPR) repeat protein
MKCGFPKLLSFFALCLFLLSSCKDEEKKANYDVPVNDRAVQELSAKISNDPTNAMLFFQRGSLLHRIQEDSLALEDMKKAVSLDSTKAQYYSAIGDILFEHKDISGSVTWLQKAIKLNPKDPTAQLKVAKMFIFLEDYNKAFEAINTVLRQDVYNAEGYFLKGMAYKGIKDTAKALSSFQTAINAQPEFREAIIQLASIYSSKGDPVAIKYYENAFRIDSTDVSPIYNTGLYYLNKNDIEAAKEQYKKAIMKDRNYANAFFGMGFALMQQDSIEKAWRQFDIVVGIEPTNTDAYYNRGLCSEMMGKIKEAIADYEQTLTFNADYAPAAEALKRVKGK